MIENYKFMQIITIAVLCLLTNNIERCSAKPMETAVIETSSSPTEKLIEPPTVPSISEKLLEETTTTTSAAVLEVIGKVSETLELITGPKSSVQETETKAPVASADLQTDSNHNNAANIDNGANETHINSNEDVTTRQDEDLHNETSNMNNNTIDKITSKIEAANDDDNKIPIDDEDYAERKEYAKKMLSYMNQSVDPCDDFYEYSCGNWKNVIPERQSPTKRSNLIDIIYDLSDMVEDLLEHPSESLANNYSAELETARQFYRSCLKAHLLPVSRSEAYLERIKAIGGFPAVDATWKADNFSWVNMSAHLTNYGGVGLINEQQLSQYPFPPYFKFPELGFEYFVHSDNIETNVSRGRVLNEKRMRDYLMLYGVDEAKVPKIIADIFDFWRAVLKVADTFDDDFDQCEQLDLEQEEKDEEAGTETPKFEKWSHYSEISWNNKEFPILPNKCPCHYFYVKLDEICEQHKEAVANYLAMKFIFLMDARLEDKRFQKEFCTLRTKQAFAYFIDELYIKKYLNDEIRDQVYTIIKEIRKSLRAKLEEADWLDEATRSAALLKESTIIERVGKYEDPVISERLIREINNLNITDDYDLNNMEAYKFKQTTTRYLGLHFDEISNDTKPLPLLLGMQVNAFYYNIDNSITVMAGILNPPSYHKSWPASLKYGTLGFLVGHEFTHGYDSTGANYNSKGEEVYWWTNKSGKVFNERTNCYVEHYASYTIPEIKRKINGNLTKDENIADSGGLREALMSYRNHIAELKRFPGETDASVDKNEVMPGIDLTPEQLFFVGFAQLWCAAYKEEHYWEELTNEHTIDKYRVLGALSNIEDFAKVYQCPLGSKMNPEADKCQVW